MSTRESEKKQRSEQQAVLSQVIYISKTLTHKYNINTCIFSPTFLYCDGCCCLPSM